MSTKDFGYLGKQSNVTNLDFIGQKYGVYRNSNESLEEFKYRCYSTFTHPSSLSNAGQSSGHSRALGHSPKNIGYIKIDPNYRIYFNGYSLTVYFADLEAEERVKVLEYKLTDHVTIEDFKISFENLSANNLVVIDDSKYLTKDICFLMPFVNFGTARKNLLGGQYKMPGTLDLIVIPESIRSNSSYIKNRVMTPDEVLKVEDFYYNESTKTFYFYDNGERDFVTVIYSYYHKYIPLWYCPVMSYQISNIINTSDAYIDYNSPEPNTFVNVDNPEILDFVFISKLVNAGWKALQTSPVAVNGTYYDK